MAEVSFFLAFLAGLVSFVSPCCLPLIPAYVSYVTGASLQDLEEKKVPQGRIMVHSILFVAGFSLIFILMGTTSTFVGRFLTSHLDVLKKISGVIIIIFGLHYSGLMRLNPLYGEKRLGHIPQRAGLFGSVLVGITFAAGWTPCIGPILGSILAYAATYETMREGMLLLTFYSAGLAVPFLFTSLGVLKFYSSLSALKRHMGTIQTIAGFFMILVGILVFFDLFSRLAGLFLWPGMI